MPDKKPEVYNFSHPDGIFSQMSDKRQDAFISALDRLDQKKARAERKKAEGAKPKRPDSTAA